MYRTARDGCANLFRRATMFEISVEESFAAGHALRGYRGKCENPHGHNYKVRITLAGEELDPVGMLCDFKDLKSAMGEIIERFDHQYLNDLEPFKQLNPSAENLARYFYQHTSDKLRQMTNGRVQVKDVRVWETDSTTATYFE
jgi:6-pyruvoyltetrahydropterin/6-carboxytetrahydropterin synthase